MKTYCVAILIAVLLISSCQAETPTVDSAIIQNTAFAVALTNVAQTRNVDIVSTVNAQGTQIAILSQPTIAITPTRSPLYILDKEIGDAIAAAYEWNELDIQGEEFYNDGQLAIGTYFRTGPNATVNDSGFWFGKRNGNGQWIATYISQGLPLCDKIEDFAMHFPLSCLDANGNEIMN